MKDSTISDKGVDVNTTNFIVDMNLKCFPNTGELSISI
jgi:hypothetical protein